MWVASPIPQSRQLCWRDDGVSIGDDLDELTRRTWSVTPSPKPDSSVSLTCRCPSETTETIAVVELNRLCRFYHADRGLGSGSSVSSADSDDDHRRRLRFTSVT